jgi:hypothetical protein
LAATQKSANDGTRLVEIALQIDILKCSELRFGAKRWNATKHLLKFCSVYPWSSVIHEKDRSPSQKQSAPV